MPEAPVHGGRRPSLHDVLECYAQADADTIEARLTQLKREWDLDHALETHAALAGLASLIVAGARGLTWSWLPVTVFVLLLQQGLQGWSPPVPLLRRLGFRSRAEIDQEILGLRLLRGDFRDVLAPTAPAERVERVFRVLQGGRAITMERNPAPSWRKKFRDVRTAASRPPVRAGTVIAGDVHAENFIEHVKSRWPAEDPQLDKTLRAVLAHLKWRLSPSQAKPLFEQLPRTIAKAADGETPHGYALGEPPKTRIDAEEFFDEIANETGLARKEVEKATLAIFSSMKRNIPSSQNRAMRAMLPKGLKRVWLRA
ncbi:MAG: DUF2267 domain-containing protein [Thiohalomonadaceae bacterium]